MRTTISGEKGTDTNWRCGSAVASIPRRAADPTAGRRAGNAAVLVLIGLLVAAGVAAWALLSSPGKGSDGPSRAVREVETEQGDDPLANPGDALADELRAPSPVGRVDVGEPGLYAQLGRVFDGAGTIGGTVMVDPGVPYPDQWTVILEPSRVAQGSERAVHQELESEPGQRTFELRDLPMAAYRIRAEAPGMRSMAQEIAMFKIEGNEHLPGIDRVNVTLKLRPVAYVDGAVRTSQGEVADDLPVFLVSRDGDGAGATTLRGTTDSAGIFRFDGVESGAWALHVGREARPLVAPIPVTVAAKAVRMDDVELPELATLRLVVIDELSRPCPDVKLIGYLRGAGSGSFNATTDAVGNAVVRYLTPGPWRIEADDPNDGQTGRTDIALTANDPDARFEIQIR